MHSNVMQAQIEEEHDEKVAKLTEALRQLSSDYSRLSASRDLMEGLLQPIEVQGGHSDICRFSPCNCQ